MAMNHQKFNEDKSVLSEHSARFGTTDESNKPLPKMQINLGNREDIQSMHKAKADNCLTGVALGIAQKTILRIESEAQLTPEQVTRLMKAMELGFGWLLKPMTQE
jgi:hypothetical protein